jgi:hypothetical protein
MLRKALFVLALAGLVWGCTTSSQHKPKTQKRKGQAPVLVDHYAAEVVRSGNTWKLYLQAKDKDGDMKYIGVLMYQPGVGYYPISVTYIKEEESKEFAGYVFMRVPADKNLIGDTLELTVVVRDHNQNASASINLKLAFAHVSTENVPEKWQFATEHRLGALKFEISRTAGWGR